MQTHAAESADDRSLRDCLVTGISGVAERVIVGLNKFTVDVEPEPKVFPIDPALERGQRERVQSVRASRAQDEVTARLDDVKAAARGSQNLLYPMKEALRARATLGEVSDALREVFGVYQPGR